MILTAICAYLFEYSPNVLAVEKTLIFPIPRQIELATEVFALDESISIVVPQSMSEKDVFLARFLIRELSDKYGIAIKMESRAAIPEGRKVIVMGSVDNPLVREYCTDNNLDLTKENPGPEGYILHVSNNRIVIAGSDDPGAFFGLQSLRQLIAAEKGLAQPALQGDKAICAGFGKHRFFQALPAGFYGPL